MFSSRMSKTKSLVNSSDSLQASSTHLLHVDMAHGFTLHSLLLGSLPPIGITRGSFTIPSLEIWHQNLWECLPGSSGHLRHRYCHYEVIHSRTSDTNNHLRKPRVPRSLPELTALSTCMPHENNCTETSITQLCPHHTPKAYSSSVEFSQHLGPDGYFGGTLAPPSPVPLSLLFSIQTLLRMHSPIHSYEHISSEKFHRTLYSTP